VRKSKGLKRSDRLHGLVSKVSGDDENDVEQREFEGVRKIEGEILAVSKGLQVSRLRLDLLSFL